MEVVKEFSDAGHSGKNINGRPEFSRMHEHILSGILRCPVCHGAMYSNVNRKKKPDGT